MTRLEQRLADAQAKVKAIDTQTTLRDKAQQDLAALDTQLQALPDTVADETALVTVRERITRGRANLAEAERVHREAAHAKKITAQREALTQTIADLDRLVDAFGPRGIRETLLGQRLGALTARVNEILAAFGLALEFAVDPWEVRLNKVPPALMARSELFRAGIAFQVALAATTGTRFAVLDGIDILDGANRAALFGVLDKALAEGWLTQALVLATPLSEAAYAKSWPPAWAVYRIEKRSEGSVLVRLGREAAA